MKKWKATVLLVIVLVLTAVFTFLAFASFEVGVKDFNGFLGAIQTDYDLSGGRAYTLTLAKDNEEDVKDVGEVINTLNDRLLQLGYNDFRIVANKNVDKDVTDYDLRIEIRGGTDLYGNEDTSSLTSDINVAAAYGNIIVYGGTSANPTEEILTAGDPIANAEYAGATSDGDSTYYQVAITFSDYGYKELMKLINDNSEYYVQINLGETVLLSGSSALSANYFNGKTLSITSPSETSAKQFALQIRTGGLAYKYEVGSSEKIVSVLGKDAAKKCVIAVAEIALVLAVAMFLINKGYGLVNLCTSVVAMDGILFFLMAVPGIKMSIGGFIAVVLTWLLIAVGYVFVSLRIKEEIARGKTIKSAVKAAYNRALAPILGGSLIIIAAALLVMAFSTGAVYNFAVVLAIGTVVAAVSTLAIARMFDALILALIDNKEKFLGVKRGENAENEIAEEK
ncbi:MAG: hypothetical protein IJQ66_02260 [Clostridia bacterium]|nr:hypothetical protein [Clostridia bacterium]